MDIIHTESLITLVEERPCIWDKTLELYKDKNAKTIAWREICVILKKDFDKLEQKDKKEFAKIVLKKWTQTRDTWMRCIKKQKQAKSPGFSGKPSRLYIYHEQLSFLNKIRGIDDDNIKEDRLDASNDATETDEHEFDFTLNVAKPREIIEKVIRKKRKTDEVDAKMMSFIDHLISLPQEEDSKNRHLSFFKSILPSLASLDDLETLEFQSGVINVLQRIKRQKEHKRSHTQYYEPQSSGDFNQTKHSQCTEPQPHSTQTQVTGFTSEVSQSSAISIKSEESDDPDLSNI